MWKKIQDAGLALLTKLGKSLAIKVVQKEGDRLQREVKAAVLSKGIIKFDDLFDAWQNRLLGWVTDCRFLPNALKSKAKRIIKDEGDKLQARVHSAAEAGGPDAIDKAFDTAQEAIIKRISEI